MEDWKNRERLAGLVLKAAAFALIAAMCWYFRNALTYIIIAAVVSLLCRPLSKCMRKLSIKGRRMPDWLIAAISLILVCAIVLTSLIHLIPVIGCILSNVTDRLQGMSFNSYAVTEWFDKTNMWLIERIPDLGRGFRIQDAIADWVGKAFNVSKLTSVVGSVASVIGSIGIGIFSVVFISFFFVKDESLFRKIIGAIVPENIENEAIVAVGEIESLLTRYFAGLFVEVAGVAVLNFLGLWLVGGLEINGALGLAFIAGILNIIPYVGPWIGAAIGTVAGTVIKFGAGSAVAGASVWTVAATILAVFLLTQIVDNFLFQPMIYSKSIKSSPLEIFIVLLMAGHIGGVVGMLVAIPSYTVIRVVASRFLRFIKPVRRLMEATEAADQD